MRFILPLLAVFMFTSCVNSVIKRKGDRTPTSDKPMPYDMPATAPIPPEKYCFEQTASAAGTKIELYTEGDSAYGKIVYAKTENIPSGDFKGVVYGTTLLINYRYQSDSGIVYQEQEWKFINDSIYQVNSTRVADSISALQGAAHSLYFAGVLHKVSCK